MTELACHLPPDRRDADWPIHSVDPPETAGYCKLAKDVCPSVFLPLDRIWTELERFAPRHMSWYVINVGARDGTTDDPLYPLIKRRPNISGVALEPSKPVFDRLVQNLRPFQYYVPRMEGIDPDTAASVLRRGPKPSKGSIDVLKIDIDMCECHILSVLLAEADSYFHAKVIMVEVNQVLPPYVHAFNALSKCGIMCGAGHHGGSEPSASAAAPIPGDVRPAQRVDHASSRCRRRHLGQRSRPETPRACSFQLAKLAVTRPVGLFHPGGLRGPP